MSYVLCFCVFYAFNIAHLQEKWCMSSKVKKSIVLLETVAFNSTCRNKAVHKNIMNKDVEWGLISSEILPPHIIHFFSEVTDEYKCNKVIACAITFMKLFYSKKHHWQTYYWNKTQNEFFREVSVSAWTICNRCQVHLCVSIIITS